MAVRCLTIAVLGLSPLCGGCLASWNVDSWATDSPYRYDQEWVSIEPNLVHIVPPQNLEEAKQLLRESSIVPLSLREGSHFIGTEVPGNDGGKYYLVRAVALDESNGRYYVSTREGAVRVHHQCWGGSPVWMKRRALVVQLPFEPRNVFVTCGMTQ